MTLGISFVSVDVGYVLSRPGYCLDNSCPLRLATTTDAGRTLHLVATSPGSIAMARDVRFATPTDGYVFGPALRTTHDGGASWRTIVLPAGIADVEIAGSRAWAIVGAHDRPQLWSSATSLDAWRFERDLPMRVGTLSMTAHGDDVWVAGQVKGDAQLRGAVLHVHAGGAQLSTLPPCDGLLYRVGAATAHDVWVLCGGQPATIMEERQFLVSHDGGATWAHTSPTSPPASIRNGYPTAIAPAPGTSTSALISLDRIGLALTTDEGRTEHTVLFDGDGEPAYAAFLTDTRAVGYHGADLLISDDGGHTFTLHAVPQPAPPGTDAIPAACDPSVLSLDTGTVRGDHDRLAVSVVVTNEAAVPCVLPPYPELTFLDADGAKAPATTRASTRPAAGVVLAAAGGSRAIVVDFGTDSSAGPCMQLRNVELELVDSAPLRLDDSPVAVCGPGRQHAA